MHAKLRTSLIASALCVAASSCASKVTTRPTFPPVADIQPAIEPAYPIEALAPGDAGRAAEDKWRDDILLWARGEHGKVVRVCKWGRDLGLKLPADYCD